MNIVIFRAVILPTIESPDPFQPAEDCDNPFCVLGKNCLDAAQNATDLPEDLGHLSPGEAARCKSILDRPCCSHPQVREVCRLAKEMMR